MVSKPGSDVSPRELLELEIFRGIAFEAIEALLRSCEVQELAAGESLLQAGQTNAHMYLILSGSLSVHLDSVDEPPIAALSQGETVGELSVMDHKPTSAHVVARAPTRVMAINEDTFWLLVGASHDFALRLLLKLAGRLRANNLVVTEQSQLREQMERAALFDALTGVHNRRWFDDAFGRVISRHRYASTPLCVVMVDVDHFKKFNDVYGHAAGDKVLVSVAATLQQRLRPTDLLCRFGGEEFVVILPGTPLAGGHIAAERLRKHVEKLSCVGPGDVTLPPITVSLGVAQLAEDDSATSLLARADAALYRAKAEGRNRVVTGAAPAQ
jgi:diguanylate cyclase (GGDEF)-like protein